MKRRLSCIKWTLILGMVFSMASAANAFPTKPLKIIVPFSPGGTADQLARSFAAGMSDELGHPVITENRPGAGGVVAARTVAQEPADGHTMLLNTTSTLLLTPMLYKSIPYTAEDLKPLIIAAEAPLVVIGNPHLPVSNFEEFVKYAKTPGQRTSYASLGPGNLMQLATEILKTESGMDELLHVPYNGQTDLALLSVMAGETDIFIDVVSHASTNLRAGKALALAVTTLERQPVLPDTPTLDELGYKGFRAVTYYGLAIRNGTPEDVQGRLRKAAYTVMQNEKFIETFNDLGLVIQEPRTAEQVRQYAEGERALWAKVIEENNLSLD